MEFDNLLKQACSIKSYQLNQDKKKFENSPDFIKSTLYCSDIVKNVRNQNFHLKKFAFETFRITGVKLISKGAFEDALFRFEKVNIKINLGIYYISIYSFKSSKLEKRRNKR